MQIDVFGSIIALDAPAATPTATPTPTPIPTVKIYKTNNAYVENSAVHNLDYKQSVRVSTTENISLSGLKTIDGVLVSFSDRVLVKDQDNAWENGIYLANSDYWNRSIDANDGFKVTCGMFVLVEEGDLNSITN